jgi:phospholipid-transporting ATPase
VISFCRPQVTFFFYFGKLLRGTDQNWFFPIETFFLKIFLGYWLKIFLGDIGGEAFIQTSSLDGEKTLKPKLSLAETQRLANDNNGNPNLLNAYLTCDPPDSNLYKAHGSIKSDVIDRQMIFSEKNFLLRGANLKNTSWVVGLVAYTGEDTKIMRNAEPARHKTSNMEHLTNKIIVGIFAFQMMFCLTLACLCIVWNHTNGDNMSYFIEKRSHPFVEGV